MTEGWHGESARHALAAKGIPTAATRIARGYHTARPLQDRLDDEARVEPYVEDIALWAQNPDSYDLKGVDDPVPEGYEIERKLFLDKGRVEIIIKEKGEENQVGTLDIRCVGKVDDIEYYSFSINVIEGYRGEGLSRYLMRNMINLADDMGIGITGIITPGFGSVLDNNILASYYASFGFSNTGKRIRKGVGEFDVVRPPQPKEGSLNE